MTFYETNYYASSESKYLYYVVEAVTFLTHKAILEVPDYKKQMSISICYTWFCSVKENWGASVDASKSILSALPGIYCAQPKAWLTYAGKWSGTHTVKYSTSL